MLLIDLMMIKDDSDEHRKFVQRFIVVQWESYFISFVRSEEEKGNTEVNNCYMCWLENERLNLIEIRYYIPDSLVELIGLNYLRSIIPYWAQCCKLPEDYKYKLSGILEE